MGGSNAIERETGTNQRKTIEKQRCTCSVDAFSHETIHLRRRNSVATGYPSKEKRGTKVKVT